MRFRTDLLFRSGAQPRRVEIAFSPMTLIRAHRSQIPIIQHFLSPPTLQARLTTPNNPNSKTQKPKTPKNPKPSTHRKQHNPKPPTSKTLQSKRESFDPSLPSPAPSWWLWSRFPQESSTAIMGRNRGMYVSLCVYSQIS